MPRRDHLERAVLDALWAAPDGLTAVELLARLTDRKLAVTTVLTVLDRLRRKGMVDRVRDGRGFRHLAVHTREQVAAEAMLAVLADVDDRALVLSRFVDAVGPDGASQLRAALGRTRPGDAAGSAPGR